MRPSRLARALAAGGLLAACGAAHAVLFYFNAGGTRSITLQVGSNNATVNTVTFDVLNANVAPTPAPVQGVAGNGAPATSPAGGILVVVSTNRRGNAPDVVKLLANSSAGMACVSGVCTTSPLTIPFSTVSWTSYETGGGAFASGIPSGTFNGSGSQSLFTATVPGGAGNSLIAANVLVFRYANTTLYPSGNYRGQVVYTAAVP